VTLRMRRVITEPVGPETPDRTDARGRHRAPPRSPTWLTGVATHVGVIVVFTVPAVVLWWRAWSGGPGSTVRCACADAGQQVWFVAWPAYALAHGLNPLSTTWLWPPHGVNLLVNASATLVGVVLAPVTWAFGPFVATTVALTLAPGLSAWACWLACRRFVAWAPACWVAGFVFGYSPFVVDSVAQGHLSGGLLVVPPLMVVVLHEILVGQTRSAAWYGIALGALVAAQFFISQEVLVITVLTAVVAVVVTAVVSPRRAVAAFPYALKALALAVVVAVVLLAGPVWYAVHGPQTIKGAVWSGEQVFAVGMLFQLWNPGAYRALLVTLPGGVAAGPPLNFVGYGVLAGAAASLAAAWRSRAAWIMAIVAVVMTACSFGGAIFLSAHHAVAASWLPWPRLWYKPVFEDILPVHFAALVDLAVAIVIAVGLGAVRTWSVVRRMPSVLGSALLVVVALAMVVPMWATYSAPLAVAKVALPPWYATAAHTVPAGSVVVSYPFPASVSVTAQPLVWQAADDMRFRLAGGYVKVPGPHQSVLGLGPPGSATRTLDTLTGETRSAARSFTVRAGQVGELRSALRRWHASYVVVTDTGPAPVVAAALFTAVTGTAPHVSHRAWVWELPRHPPPASSPAEAATAFRVCRTSVPRPVAVARGRPLPQDLNACIAAAGSGSGAAAG